MTDSTNKPRVRVGDGGYVRATDGLQSLISNMGDPSRDKSASTVYTHTALGDHELENGYRFSWIIKKIVNIPALDALRKWRDWQGEAKQIKAIKAEEKRLKLKKKLIDAQKMARLWGGSAIFINTGQNTEEPLEIEKVGAGGIQSLTVFTRKELTADTLDNDPFSENFGKPLFYNVTAQGGEKVGVKIHYSHLAVFIGAEHPDVWMQTGQNFGWGDSIIQSVHNQAKQTDSTLAGVASLVFEANIDVFAIPDFMASMGDKDYEKRILDRFIMNAKGKGISGAIVHDAEEKYERKQINFTQLPDVMQKFANFVCGAAGIPITKFLGEQSKGMGDKGEGDMRNYYDDIATIQELEIEPATETLDECLIRSALGNRPEEIEFEWTPLQQLNEKEIADIGKTISETSAKLVDTGLYDPEAVEEATTNQMVQMKIFPTFDTIVNDHKRDFDSDREFEVESRQNQGAKAGQTEISDAAPRSLYIHRKIKNGDDIIAWAKSQGISKTLKPEDLHVTIAFSRDELDWMKLGEAWQSEIKIAEGGARIMEQFDGGATVLLFKANELEWRHREVLRHGGSFDYDEYEPHITITYGETPALSDIEPYQGEIVLGPEIFQEVDLEWKDEIEEIEA